MRVFLPFERMSIYRRCKNSWCWKQEEMVLDSSSSRRGVQCTGECGVGGESERGNAYGINF